MAGEIEPIFTADINNPNDMELLKKYFGVEAINKAFGDGEGGMDEILTNASFARLMQKMERSVPPEVQETNRQVQEIFERQAAIARQTRKPEKPKFTGNQLGLF